MPKYTAEVRLKKKGPNGTPFAEISVDNGVSSDQMGSIIQKVTRDKDLMRKLGLKACLGCISGLDIDFRDRYDDMFKVEV